MKRVLGLLLLIVLISSAILVAATYLQYFQANPQFNANSTDFHLGVSFCGNTSAEAKLLIDKVRNYTNLLIVQSGPVSINETALNEIVDYAVSSGLDIIVYFGFFNPNYPWQLPWVESAKQRLGDQFLGVYYYDEPGGILIDYNWTAYFSGIRELNASNYNLHKPEIDLALNATLPLDLNEAAYHFVTGLEEEKGLSELKKRSITAITSDYALYWFDYLGGYDVLLAQYGWNQSIIKETALVRGAANMQDKDWGAIITWTYTQPPYLADGEKVYDQMASAYKAGAKYVVVFNYPSLEGNPYGVMKEEHFEALKRLWNEIFENKIHNRINIQVALVLPSNYGWGMRNLNDSIWGIWSPDKTSEEIWNILQELMTRYNLSLDIVYYDVRFPVEDKYEQVYYWNQTLPTID